MSQTQTLEAQVQTSLAELIDIDGRIMAANFEFNGIVKKIHDGVPLQEHNRLNTRLEELLANMRALNNRRAHL